MCEKLFFLLCRRSAAEIREASVLTNYQKCSPIETLNIHTSKYLSASVRERSLAVTATAANCLIPGEVC